MGCNCKNIKKLDKMLVTNDIKYNKKGLLGFISNFSITLFNKIFVISLMILVILIVIIYFIIMYLFGGSLVFKTPKFIKKIIEKTKDNG